MTVGVQRERELKLALEDPSALDRLLAALPEPSEVVEQTNRYFVDPDGLLQRARLMVRVREERDVSTGALLRVILTLKERARVVDGYFEAQEHEAPLDPASWDPIRRGEASLLDLDTDALAPLRSLPLVGVLEGARMTNVRHRVSLDGFCLEVDRTTFPGDRVEAEVEVETDQPERARALLLGVARDAGVELRPQSMGKFTRLQRAIGERL